MEGFRGVCDCEGLKCGVSVIRLRSVEERSCLWPRDLRILLRGWEGWVGREGSCGSKGFSGRLVEDTDGSWKGFSEGSGGVAVEGAYLRLTPSSFVVVVESLVDTGETGLSKEEVELRRPRAIVLTGLLSLGGKRRRTTSLDDQFIFV